MMGKLFGPRQLGGRCRRKPVQLRFEAMESRLLLAAPFLVTTAADNGDNLNPTPGSLRQAILTANSTSGQDTIDFQIGSGGFQSIFPLSPLPTITDQVTIDGTSQPGYTTFPLIAIVGTLAGSNANGLTISAGGSTVQGLDIVRFSGNGIDLNSNGRDVIVSNIIGTDASGHFGLGNAGSGVLIDDVPGNVIGTSLATGNVLSGNAAGLTISGGGATGNLVQGNLIGTDASGSNPVGNGAGVMIIDAPGNTIGGTVSGAVNVISGNGVSSTALTGGILILNAGATGNLIEGNRIGTTKDGKLSLSNVGYGIILTTSISTPTVPSASGNTIGGTAQGAGNLISGNLQGGITIVGLNGGGRNNLIQGNLIGTDVNGTNFLDNRGDGILISNAANNLIGGPTQSAGNVISGNLLNGIHLIGTGASGNLIQGNFIGTVPDGTSPLGNVADGVLIAGGFRNIIGGNLISGNAGNGIEIDGSGASGTVIQGNRIGTSPNGELRLVNFQNGILINGSPGNLIGGLTTTPGTAPGNLISGNRGNGVVIVNQSATGNLVQGNLIGTDAAGTGYLGNGQIGVDIEDASNNLIGGTTPGARNVISGNQGTGVRILNTSNDPTSVTGNLVEGNFIGTKASGLVDISSGYPQPFLSNLQGGVAIISASGNTIGGTDPNAFNLISGNEGAGVLLSFGALRNLVEGNLIGPDLTGRQYIGNTGSGVVLDTGALNNTIGGTTPQARNVISGNGESGIMLLRQANNNLIEGNLIGTDATGTDRPLGFNTRQGNFQNGITFLDLAYSNTIVSNIISGNSGDGVNISTGSTGNLIEGNFVGTALSGLSPLGNGGNGISINDVSGNTISGDLISGNSLNGVLISAGTGKTQTNTGSMVQGNTVQGNRIGTDVNGASAISNGQNGVFLSGSVGNTIGGTTSGAGNVISGNHLNGISFFGSETTGNLMQGNLIGTDATGTVAVGNSQNGVLLTGAPGNFLGGPETGAGNIISGNAGDGIAITGASASGNMIQGDLIGTDLSGAHSLGNAGDGIAISQATTNQIGGTAAGARNVISGNAGNGISVTDTNGVAILGNRVGTDLAGTYPVGNDADGVLLDSSSGNMVGGTAAGARNVISGNGIVGIEIRGQAATGNLVQGNFIGTDWSGESFLGGNGILGNLVGVYLNDAKFNTIGGTAQGAGNVISGNLRIGQAGTGIGVQILGNGETGNLVQGNLIGTDAMGSQPLGNNIGVFLSGVAGNTIGGVSSAARNLISGNTNIGVYLAGAGTVTNAVEGNWIGLDATGTRTLVAGRPDLGVLVSDTPGTNTIGGTVAGAGNVVSGFQVGIEIFATQSQANPTPGNLVAGNLVGTDATGTIGLGNNVGIYINGMPRNTIGGTSPAARNVISANNVGIELFDSAPPGSATPGNLVEGNFIGLDASGNRPLGNHTGIFINGAWNNTIGGTAPGTRNVIAGNMVINQDGSTGIYLYNGASNNTIEGNLIGTDASGRSGRGLAQGDYGVLLFNSPNNPIARSLGTNRVVGSGIANLREYTGPVTQPLSGGSGTTRPRRSQRPRRPQRPQRTQHPQHPIPSGPRKLPGFVRLGKHPISRGQ